MVILTGTDYPLARLVGVWRETFVAKIGKIPSRENIIQYGDGNIVTLTEEVEIDGVMTEVTSYGLVLDETNEYYSYLHPTHQARVVEYVSPIVEE